MDTVVTWPWSVIKDAVDNKNFRIRYVDTGKVYLIKAVDEHFELCCILHKTPTDTTDRDDFVNNYKAKAENPVHPIDSDGSHLARVKITRTGWAYQLFGFEIETAKTNGVYAKDEDGNSLNYFTHTMYDTNGDVTTTEANAVKTVVDFEPPWDYELIGGRYKHNAQPQNDMYYFLCAVPDLTPAQGGSKFFVYNVELKYISTSGFMVADGRAPKLLQYNATYHTNKLRFIIRHSAGEQLKFLQLLELFKA